MSIENFAYGARVRVKTLEEIEAVPGAEVGEDGIHLPDGYWNFDMNQHCGKEATVIYRRTATHHQYLLDIDSYLFSYNMLKPYVVPLPKDSMKFEEELL